MLKTYRPYIEITRKRDSDSRYVYSAFIHIKGDHWAALEHTDLKSSASNFFQTDRGFINRVRRFADALGIELEESF